ncbi:hypothetical protein GGR50DRAFT_547078 [Xylaria sp. CBS 124048]|nr:hypothetical protein GGR50DRAFT_547078 [Xylaria sp. CBS 124048]
MASTFRPVNSTLMIKVEKHDGMAASPTTPTPATTTFGQRPLPSSPFPQAVRMPDRFEEKGPKRDHSRLSRGDSEDVDMDDSDKETHGNEEGAVSDDESINGDGSKSHKKKKSQRFYCTDFPPCSLSFTRSEHLARHIRKHTGERPFQCHCTRRFSRLDNLRQHAQTVHVNEDIPMDSLAATGTRFQRQIRTDRVRQPGRARASTAGSMGAPVRGHSKSLSASSIGSIMSNYSPREDIRRHPPPLVMAEHRFPFPSEAFLHSHVHRPPSPSDFSTPTSATFSTGQDSPRWGPVMASPTPSHTRSHSMYTPTSSHSRSHSMYAPTSSHSRSHSLYAGPRAPARRLSVPSSSGVIPFQSQLGPNTGRPTFGPVPVGAFGGSGPPAPYPPASSAVASPTSSIFVRRDSTSDERRKTWHPESNNYGTTIAGSGLSHVITPSQYPSPPQTHDHMPVYHPQPNSRVRLPGIESFDPLPQRPASPRRGNLSPIIIDPKATYPSALYPATNPTEFEDKRTLLNSEMSLHRGLTRLDIASVPVAQGDGPCNWTREVSYAMNSRPDRVGMTLPPTRFR